MCYLRFTFFSNLALIQYHKKNGIFISGHGSMNECYLDCNIMSNFGKCHSLISFSQRKPADNLGNQYACINQNKKPETKLDDLREEN